MVGDPADGAVSVALDARSCLDSGEVIALDGVLDMGVNEKRVGFGVNVPGHDLGTVEAACLGHLNFIRKVFTEVLVDYAIRDSEEGEDMRNEVALIVV